MKIEICNICEGKGEVEKKDLDFDAILCKCKKCDGSGRLITGIVKYEVPFTKDKSLIYTAEERLFRIKRQLETSKDY